MGYYTGTGAKELADSEIRNTDEILKTVELTFWMQYLAREGKTMYIGYCECSPDFILPSDLPIYECQECGEWIDLSPLVHLPSGGEKLSFLRSNAPLIVMIQTGTNFGAEYVLLTESVHGAEDHT
jgi:hypothetical protein